MWHAFFEFSFWVVALGTTMIALAGAWIGSINVFKRQSLIGDAIGHSSFPGIVIVFMLLYTRQPLPLMLGAFISGGLSFLLIQIFQRYTFLKADALMAIFLSSFFGLGMTLRSYIQKIPEAAQAQLHTYIFGHAAFIKISDVKIITVFMVIILLIFILFYKEITLYIFDPTYAQVNGFKPKLLSYLTLFLTLILISVGIKAVGAILISSVLIAPVVAAKQWSARYGRVLVIASFFAITSGIFGTFISYSFKGFSTGPSIILVLSFWAIISILFSPQGILKQIYSRRQQRKELAKKLDSIGG